MGDLRTNTSRPKALNVGYNEKQVSHTLPSRIVGGLARYARGTLEAGAEFLWPTRCVGCGRLDYTICDSCYGRLRFIDQWRACPVCGAPYGLYQCCSCNTYSLDSLARKTCSFDACVSAVRFDDLAARMVRTRKDAGERRLAQAMGFAIACAVPPGWLVPDVVVCSVPASRAALSRRGFDHGRELARATARILRVPFRELLVAKDAADQRGLGRTSRVQNVQGRFAALGPHVPARVLLIDDVYTTGATAMAASDALRAAGACYVFVATFARV